MPPVRVVYDPCPPSGIRPGVCAESRMQTHAARPHLPWPRPPPGAGPREMRCGWRCFPIPVLKHGPATACGGKTRKRA